MICMCFCPQSGIFALLVCGACVISSLEKVKSNYHAFNTPRFTGIWTLIGVPIFAFSLGNIAGVTHFSSS